jgi:hypothetical protein
MPDDLTATPASRTTHVGCQPLPGGNALIELSFFGSMSGRMHESREQPWRLARRWDGAVLTVR